MELANVAARAAARSVAATNAAAGAVTGAVVGGVYGSIKGAVTGIGAGTRSGAHSAPAAALTLAAVGAVGLVEWPVVLAVGSTGLVMRQLNSAARTPNKAAIHEADARTAAGSRAPRANASRATASK